MNRQYGEASGGDWVILSAKYGFLLPTDLIPGPCEVTFEAPSTGPMACETLGTQVQQMGLDRYAEVVGLCGKEYRAAVEAAFRGTDVTLDSHSWPSDRQGDGGYRAGHSGDDTRSRDEHFSVSPRLGR